MNYTSILYPSIIRPFAFEWKFSLKSVWISGFLLIISLIGFYVFQINSITQSSFAIANHEKKIAGLDKEFKNLQINFSDKSSLSGIENALVSEGYEKVGQIRYIQVLDDTVALIK